jgi:small subunit ribosomal protein S2
MAVVSMKALLESGVHFGHRTHKWNPGMKPFIFTERNGIHIIDLQKTAKAIEHVYSLVRTTVSEGGTVLFVGTKRQAQETVQNEATRAGMPYVTQRWLGGMLTNWRTIRGRINELERLERMRDSGDFERITKKEGLILSREIERLEILLSGIRNMIRIPELLFVVDVYRESTAIHEANLLKIPVIAMVDTNCDPRNVDYVIPSNDDAIRAIKLVVGKIADAAVEGRAARKEEEPELAMALETTRAAIDEPELTDEELLGEATLAKISPRPDIEEEKVKEEEIEEEIIDEEDFEEEEVEFDDADVPDAVSDDLEDLIKEDKEYEEDDEDFGGEEDEEIVEDDDEL